MTLLAQTDDERQSRKSAAIWEFSRRGGYRPSESNSRLALQHLPHSPNASCHCSHDVNGKVQNLVDHESKFSPIYDKNLGRLLDAGSRTNG